MNLILFDDESRHHLLPFTHTRPVADIRCGIFSMRERWEKLLGASSSSLTAAYLQAAFPQMPAPGNNIYVNGGVFASEDLRDAVQALVPGQALLHGVQIIAFCTSEQLRDFSGVGTHIAGFEKRFFREPISKLEKTWDIFTLNAAALQQDFLLITRGRKSAAIPGFVTAICPENIFIEETAVLNPAIINAAHGSVYIGSKAEVMEGCMIRGVFSLCSHAVLKMGAKVYGATTIGPGCKVGGEISNAVFFSNSNKGHDGFIGNAVIGEWCNLGADTNCSNLKNNYDEVRVWSEYENKSVKTGLQFCGLLMGDHSKCGINTMFNTGTVVGVSANIFGGNFPAKFVPSFSWGGSDKMETYQLEKAIDTANRMMARRGQTLSEAEVGVLEHIFEQSRKQRDLLH